MPAGDETTEYGEKILVPKQFLGRGWTAAIFPVRTRKSRFVKMATSVGKIRSRVWGLLLKCFFPWRKDVVSV
jgi:hypothetical protein